MNLEKSKTTRIVILLVEDDPGDVELVREMLDACGGLSYELNISDRCSRALEILDKQKTDIILLDLGLPDSEGLETLIKVRSFSHQIPIVVLTGLEDEALGIEAVKEGAQDYLVKGNIEYYMLGRYLKFAMERQGLSSRLEELALKLQESESRLRDIIRGSVDGIIVVDRDGVVRFVNPAAEALFTFQESEIIGERLSFQVEPGKNTELDIPRVGGETLTAEIRVAEITWEEQPAYLASLRDITERKKSEKEINGLRQKLSEENQKLMESNERLKELDNLKTDFLMTASHELRTPLTIIRQFISVVKTGIVGDINKEQDECLESSLKNCDRLANLVNDLLDFERLQSGRLHIRRRNTNISAVLERCYHDFLPRCADKNQQLELASSKELPNALCDEEKINQVLINLIGNAHKFTQENGQISIKARHDNEIVTISVQDNGPGIAKEDQECIFDKFTQIDRKDGPGAKGTGLGLAISKNIIEMHDGILTVDSIPGEGSTFSFTLPTFNEKEELYGFIKDRGKMAEATGVSVFLILLKIGFDSLSPGESPTDSRVQTMKRIEEVIDSIFRRRDDEILIVPTEGLLALMMETNGKGSRAFIDRLEAELGENPESGDQIFYSAIEVKTDVDPEQLFNSAIDQLRRLEVSGARKRVLVVDDEESILPVIIGFLETTDLDLKIESTTNGYDACIKFGIFAPDLVILDIVMRGFDGIEVLKKIQENPHKNMAKILVMSGHFQYMDEAMQLGADDFLLKPFKANELIKKVTDLLGGKGKSECPLEYSFDKVHHLIENKEGRDV